MKKKPKIGESQQRTLGMAVREINEDERRVSVSFSSEQPVNRWYGQEILCHDEGCVDLTRLTEIGVSLWNHNRDKVIGRIENAVCNYTEKRAYCDIIFDDDEDSEKIYQKVRSGTLKGVSVGYTVDAWEEVRAGGVSSNGRFKGPCEVAVKWSPYEVSIVSVPADDSVGVDRTLEDIHESNDENRSLTFFERQIQINKNLI